MKWLLDTNVIREPGKSTPEARGVARLDSLQATECDLSVITPGGIDTGIHALPPDGGNSWVPPTEPDALSTTARPKQIPSNQ